ncbi:MAG: hypothetical protein IJR85_07265 [Synergistaceae bacterium]|nr:hypothetical protein [Synergistaceae bacterium]
MNYTMPRKQYFNAKAVYVLMLGLFSWLAWCSFSFVTKIVGTTDARAAYKLASQIALTCIFFFSARIIIAYDLKLHLLASAILLSGFVIVVRYAMYFDGLNFMSRIGSLLMAGGRYRNSYGFVHPNYTGFTCLYFIIFCTIYKAASEASGDGSHKYGIMSQYILVVCVISFFMMMSTGSRTSISSLVLYFMVYFLLGMYRKNAVTANALLIVSLTLAASLIMVVVDWYFVLVQSGRLNNFMPMLSMPADELITGYGFIDSQGTTFYGLGFSYLDNMYANIFARSGIVGFCLFFTPLILSMVIFFHDMRKMTKLERSIAALFVQIMYYFLFESRVYDFTWFSFVIWSISVTVMNERVQTNKAKVSYARLK